MPPIVPPHYIQAKRRMQWGLDPRVAQFSTGNQTRATEHKAPSPSSKQNTGQEHIVPMPGHPGGPVIPLGAPPPGGFVQQHGPRAGQHYNVVTGDSGLSIRKYAGGDTAIAQTDAGVSIPNQRRDMAARKNAAQAALLTELAAARQQAAARRAIAPAGGASVAGILGALMGPNLGQSRRRRTLARGY